MSKMELLASEPIEAYPDYDAKKHLEIKEALIRILGPEWVSDEPEITQAYSRDWTAPGILEPRRPEFVVLPGSVEDVRAITKLANRLKFNLLPIGTGLCGLAGTLPNRGCTVTVDLAKRMNRIIRLDSKNMYAVVEPGVTYAQLHAEALKVGLTLSGAPEAGAQAKVLANHLFFALTGKSQRYGHAPHRILGAEIVLPDGELICLGSAATTNEYFWGSGPGPDLIGLIRGLTCSHGGLGIVTKLAVKLYPWPGPRVWPVEGYIPEKRVILPKDKFRWYLIKLPSEEKVIEAIYEIGRSEIGYAVHHFCAYYMNTWWAKSCEEYWRTWEEGYFQKLHPSLAVCLAGLTSPKQLEYEEKILKQIVEELGGEFVKDEKNWIEYTASNWLLDAQGPRMHRPSGTYSLFALDILDPEWADKVTRPNESLGDKVREKYTPPLVDDDHSHWIHSIEFGHYAVGEQDFLVEKSSLESVKASMQSVMEYITTALKEGSPCGVPQMASGRLNEFAGPVMGNYHVWLRKIKEAFDPNYVANPPYPIPIPEKEPKP